ncbi:uncharacterized protein LOC129574762 isoform X2 [Sitodiplosis mosellana]|uniref:uncharacterized protein LOC129574762 isoform X2 n=1 Tax=Sitodiplosis mosellana TaxID=263140 RepID=UPI0024439DA3|nr:uncharacterized protein LOC129574762 isoform X2 [Sitodiplosis mosellana]XP_055313192.1 uncharacterized protein LOC129574762 isoform X2 [Sitodiplosis mosellana]XP_055313193.1 uncharacterized protein LOC129574762 isoform X2 [Sitodiplosis mosellana]XP_055313194.1 uncharacterized protein LOC129574762 isoform X2 [Sitodiplosis mosellana]
MDETSAAIEQITAAKNNKAADDAREKAEQIAAATAAAEIENQSEKHDVSPENLEKNSSCDITPNDDLSTSVTTTSETPNNETSNSMVDKTNDDKSDAKNKSTGFAFTIDFNEGKAIDNRKYKEIAERFQHRQQQQQEQRRHRRGVSLSKLDDSRKSSTSLNMENGQHVTSVDDSNVLTTAKTTAVAAKPPFKQRSNRIGPETDVKSDEKCDTKVVLRRPRPTAAPPTNCKDSSKRHSWSPRSSLNYDKIPQLPPEQISKDEPPTKCMENSTTSFQPKSTILQRALESNPLRPSSKGSAKATIKSTTTTTTTTPTISCGKKAMRDHVVTAPLEYVRNSDDEGSIGDASQATYTLDGDNYTEEEKERMSIDKLGKRNFDLSIESRTRNDLNRNYTSALKNVLQPNYSRDIKCESKYSQRTSVEHREHLAKTASSKTTKSYLDKLKTRVKTIGDRTFHKNTTKSTPATTNEKLMNLQVVRTDDSSPVHTDHGVFTSITACGVLNKQNLEPANNFPASVNRKHSLTKFQIDSSEYIQPKVDDALMSSYTDYEKAKHHEYKLKIFSTVSSYTSSGTSPVQTDDDNLSVECIDDKPISIKTAPTKNDWIQEWAKNARRRNNLLASSATASPKMQHYLKTGSARSKVAQLQGNNDRMSQSYDTYFNNADQEQQQQQQQQFGDDVMEDSSDECTAHTSRSIGRNASNAKTEFTAVDDHKTSTANTVLRPPISPTKIPSPMHSQLRARSSSVNRSFRNSNADLDNLDTEMYLEKTAAAISSLQKIHRKKNSPQSPLSPMRKTAPTDFATAPSITVRNNYEKSVNLRPLHLHKRNLSLDVSHNMAKSKNHEYYDSNELVNARELKEHLGKRHTRHNSYENKQIQLPSPKHGDIDQTMSRATFIEQQRLLNKYFADSEHHHHRQQRAGGGDEHARRASCGDNAIGSPIRRSSSFCNRNIANIMPMKATTPTATKKPMNRRITLAGNNNSLQKSASSSSFKKLQAAAVAAATPAYQQHYAQKENEMYYINGRDNLQTTHGELLYSSDESDDVNSTTGESCGRYESDRQASEPPISHTRYNKAFLMRMEQNKQIASGGNKGVVACPNTPEMPRRANNQRASFRDPTSMPRDSSLSRMKQDLPNLQTTKKSLTQAVSKDSSSSTSSVSKRVLPKYMDISKYKPVQGQSFLKRDESKSTLISRNEIRKSPSAIGLSKGDPMRTSGRVKSAGAKPSTPICTKDTKAREQELAMWRRRATYDPMKAAAEGRKKQEEAKKSVQSTKFGDSAVLRSQSFHSGVGQFNNLQLRQQFSEDSFNKNRWTVMSTESSDEEEFGDNA